MKRAAVGIVLQILVGLILLKIPFFRDFFLLLNRLVLSLEEATTAGTSFVFGYLGGADLPFNEKFPGAGFILAFRALPLILIMIGGMGTMAPSRRNEIVALGLRSIIAGTLATCMTGAVIGIIGG